MGEPREKQPDHLACAWTHSDEMTSDLEQGHPKNCKRSLYLKKSMYMYYTYGKRYKKERKKEKENQYHAPSLHLQWFFFIYFGQFETGFICW